MKTKNNSADSPAAEEKWQLLVINHLLPQKPLPGGKASHMNKWREA